MKHVVSSAAETEVAGIFHNAQASIPIRTILHALQHPQPPTPPKTDNSTASGFMYGNIHKKGPKSGICGIIGCVADKHKHNFGYSGTKGVTPSLTI